MSNDTSRSAALSALLFRVRHPYPHVPLVISSDCGSSFLRRKEKTRTEVKGLISVAQTLHSNLCSAEEPLGQFIEHRLPASQHLFYQIRPWR